MDELSIIQIERIKCEIINSMNYENDYEEEEDEVLCCCFYLNFF